MFVTNQKNYAALACFTVQTVHLPKLKSSMAFIYNLITQLKQKMVYSPYPRQLCTILGGSPGLVVVKRLMSWRLWVKIPIPKIVMFVWKRPKINGKEAGNGPFKLKRKTFFTTLIAIVANVFLTILWCFASCVIAQMIILKCVFQQLSSKGDSRDTKAHSNVEI